MTLGVESNGNRVGDDELPDGATPGPPPGRSPEQAEQGAGRAGGAPRGPLTEQQKRLLGVALVVHVLVVVATLRDLRRRPAAGIRGPKWAWGVAATLNTSGSAAYWIFGRRRTTRTINTAPAD